MTANRRDADHATRFPCRVLLAGGKTHSGRFGIYRPNVTITTDPASSARATVSCANTGTDDASPCIIAGDGFYDGAAHLTLKNFDIVMTAGSGPCVQLNEGQGSGGSPYWDFYIQARQLQASNYPYTVLQDMRISGCGSYGVKLSTFITNVHIQACAVRSQGASCIASTQPIQKLLWGPGIMRWMLSDCCPPCPACLPTER